MKRALWFTLGATSVFVVLKAGEYYRRLTPDGAAELRRRVTDGLNAATVWVEDFSHEFAQARHEKRAELRGLLTTTERERLS